MENLRYVLILYALLVFINILLSGALYYIHRSRLYGWLFLLWVASFLIWVVQGAAISSPPLPKILAFSVTFLGDVFLAQLLAYLGDFRLRSTYLIGSIVAGLGGTLLLHAAGAHPHLMALPVTTAVAFPVLYAGGIALLRHREQLTFSSKGMAVTALCMGVLNLTYATAFDQAELSAGGFLAGVLIVFALSSFAPAAAIEKTGQERARAEAEAKYRASLMNSAKLAALGEMAGGVAHEINTPLAIIRMNSEQLDELLGDETIDMEMTRRMTGTIRDTVERIATIVRGLRSFSRDAENDPLVMTPVREIVQDTLALCQERFRENQVSVELGEIPENAAIHCRPTQISQVLLNLLNNSFDAIHAAPAKWVRIGIELEEKTLRLSLTDCGKGIPASVQEKLFRPFFTTKEIGKGTGLGLSIARGIIEAHQGSLALDPDSPNTRFVITFPRA